MLALRGTPPLRLEDRDRCLRQEGHPIADPADHHPLMAARAAPVGRRRRHEQLGAVRARCLRGPCERARRRLRVLRCGRLGDPLGRRLGAHDRHRASGDVGHGLDVDGHRLLERDDLVSLDRRGLRRLGNGIGNGRLIFGRQVFRGLVGIRLVGDRLGPDRLRLDRIRGRDVCAVRAAEGGVGEVVRREHVEPPVGRPAVAGEIVGCDQADVEVRSGRRDGDRRRRCRFVGNVRVAVRWRGGDVEPDQLGGRRVGHARRFDNDGGRPWLGGLDRRLGRRLEPGLGPRRDLDGGGLDRVAVVGRHLADLQPRVVALVYGERGCGELGRDQLVVGRPIAVGGHRARQADDNRQIVRQLEGLRDGVDVVDGRIRCIGLDVRRGRLDVVDHR